MNSVVLADGSSAIDLFPFTLMRSPADIRIGILTIREKWERLFKWKIEENNDKNHAFVVDSNLIPTTALIKALQEGNLTSYLSQNRCRINFPWDIFQLNDLAIRQDFELITKGRNSQVISSTNKLVEPGHIFLEEGARIEHCIINASTGPVYIGRNAEVMEGSMIRGPLAIGEGALVKMGSKIYGATTIGPNSIVAGEIKNCVFFGNSNKSHDGYLGDAVIAEWCNLGAGTSASNVKNTAGEIMIWNDIKKAYTGAGSKCGLLMGDYCRSAINTSFTTGAVTGVCCNIFGNGTTPKFTPSFSWGYDTNSKYEFEKAIEDIRRWKKFKNQTLADAEIRTLKHIFDQL